MSTLLTFVAAPGTAAWAHAAAGAPTEPVRASVLLRRFLRPGHPGAEGAVNGAAELVLLMGGSLQ
jgi:hypothetical protein